MRRSRRCGCPPASSTTRPAGCATPARVGGQPARLVALLDALKPLLGLAGQPGELVFTPGVTLSGHDAGGALELRGRGRHARSSRRPPRHRSAGWPPASTRRCACPAAGSPDARPRPPPGRGRRRRRPQGGPRLAGRRPPGVPPPGDRLRHRPLPGRAGAGRRGRGGSHRRRQPRAAVPARQARRADRTVARRDRRRARGRGRRPPRPPRRHAAVHLRAAHRVRRRSGRPPSRPRPRQRLAGALPGRCARRSQDALPAERRRAGRRPGAPARRSGPVVLRWAGEPVPVRDHVDATGLPAIDHVHGHARAHRPAGSTTCRSWSGRRRSPPDRSSSVRCSRCSPAPRPPVAGGSSSGSTSTAHVASARSGCSTQPTVQLVVLDGTAPPETDPAAVAARAGRGRGHAGGVDRAGRRRGPAPARRRRRQRRRWASCCTASCSTTTTRSTPRCSRSTACSAASRACSTTWPAPTSRSRSTAASPSGSPRTAAASSAVTLGLGQRVQLTSGDVTVWLEADDTWIDPRPPVAGVAVGLVKLTGTTVDAAAVAHRVRSRHPRRAPERPAARPRVHARVRRRSTPSPRSAPTETSGGAQLQLSNLAVAVSGASGGNAIASGILADSASSGQKPKPAFSPALAVQKHGSGPVDVTLRAGDGDGPWWVAIQKGFGPLYLEQVGFGVTMPQHQAGVRLAAPRRAGVAVRAHRRRGRPLDHLLRGEGRLLQGGQLGGGPRRPRHRRRDRPAVHQRRPAQERQRRQRRVPRHAARPVRRLRAHDLRRLRQDERRRLVLRRRRGRRPDRRRARVLRHRHRRRLRHQPRARSCRPTCRSSPTTR